MSQGQINHGILKNDFSVESTTIDGWCDMYYHEDNFYYKNCYGIGDGGIITDVISYEKLSDGRYAVEIKEVNYFAGTTNGFSKAIVALKEIDGKRLWTLYYMGTSQSSFEAMKKETTVTPPPATNRTGIMKIGVDNNSFVNNSIDFFNPNEKKQRYYTSSQYLKSLTDSGHICADNVNEMYIGKWGGACFGISATMMFEYMKSSEAGHVPYYNWQMPRDNTDLRNKIHYYSLAQWSCKVTSTEVSWPIAGKSDELEELVELSKSGEPILLCVGYYADGFKGVMKRVLQSSAEGHAVVVCGYDGVEEGEHKLVIVDPNNNNNYMYLYVDEDFNDFRMSDGTIKTDNWVYLEFSTIKDFENVLLPEDQVILSKATLRRHQKKESKGFLNKLFFGTSSSFTVTNDRGETLTYDGESITGSMNYEIEKQVASPDSMGESRVLLSIDDSSSFVVESLGTNLDMSVSTESGVYFGIDGEDINTIDINIDWVEVTGTDMQYHATVKSPEDQIDMLAIDGADKERVVFEMMDAVTLTSSENNPVNITMLSENDLTDYYLESDSTTLVLSHDFITGFTESSSETTTTTIIIVCVAAGVAIIGMIVAIVLTVILIRRKNSSGKSQKNKKEMPLKNQNPPQEKKQ